MQHRGENPYEGIDYYPSVRLFGVTVPHGYRTRQIAIVPTLEQAIEKRRAAMAWKESRTDEKA
jgi:hypothetical protein